MQKIDFIASEIHYFDHMFPIWEKLPKEYKGYFFVSDFVYREVVGRFPEAVVLPPKDLEFKNSKLSLVASFGDYRDYTSGDVIFMEHGIGHVPYGVKHPGYAGGIGKDRVVLFLNQHERTLKKNKETYPNIEGAIIGTPKMDKYPDMEVKGRKVCISFHWDCQVSPESRSAFDYFKRALPILASGKDFEFVMHGHPRKNRAWQEQTKQKGITFIENFDDVLKDCDVYINDNSSTMYEFACVGKPVIVLNAPWYRRNVSGSIRFWDLIPGIQVSSWDRLYETVLRTLEKPDEFKQLRDTAVKELYPYRFQSSQRAADVIVNFLSKR